MFAIMRVFTLFEYSLFQVIRLKSILLSVVLEKSPINYLVTIYYIILLNFYKMVSCDVISCTVDITGLRLSPPYDRLKQK